VASVSHRSYLLECTPEAFRPKRFPVGDVRLAKAGARDRDRCRVLWLEVGREYWSARRRWSDARWRMHVRRPDVSFWIATRRGRDIGFFELHRRIRGVKIEGIGLLAPWRGRGLGAGLLSVATQRAFAAGARRVWLHTATDDHPHALPNYLARGYRVYRERELRHPMPSLGVAARPRARRRHR
jgi:GNAT superfamily N-acetyltransferase